MSNQSQSKEKKKRKVLCLKEKWTYRDSSKIFFSFGEIRTREAMRSLGSGWLVAVLVKFEPGMAI